MRSTPEIFTILYRKNGADLDIRSVELTATSSQTYSSNLDSLDPGSVYSYKIESRNDFETIFTPRDYSFKTLDASKFEFECITSSFIIFMQCLLQ